jgi:hypothetical protein
MNDLNLEGLGLRIGGRSEKALSYSEERELVPEDLQMLSLPRESTAPAIKKLRERHHALAKVLAAGTPPGHAALICNYSPSRISILLSDPSFQELMQLYRDGAKERYFDGHQAMAELHLDAMEELRERLEEKPEEFGNGMLMDLVKLTADRTGLGPSTKTEVDIKVGLSDRLAEARKRVAAMRDITPEGE